MRFRITFFIVVVFFAVMNVLLWRSEYAANVRLGTSVPTDVVWEKVLTSPDDSYLEVRHRGVKLGRAHWRVRLSEEQPPVDEDDPLGEASPDGMVRRVTGYSLDFSGNVAIDEQTRLRFDLSLDLDATQTWQRLTIKLGVKPYYALEILAWAREEKVTVVTTEDESRKERVFTFADLRNPEKVLRELGGPMLPAALGAMMGPLRLDPGGAAGGLVWKARHDRLVFGRTELRVYRLEARLFGRYRAVLVVSPVGEILQLELPDDLVMVNDAMFNL